jgi:alkylation response protein AidB-like acyl-CoA dehydrogenase
VFTSLPISPEQVATTEAAGRVLDPLTTLVNSAGVRVAESDAWRRLATWGWFGMGIPSSAGGIGGSTLDEALIFIEAGRGLARGPLLGTTLAAHHAMAVDQLDLLAQLLGGELTAGLLFSSTSAPIIDRDRVVGDAIALDATGTDLVLAIGPEGAALVETAALSLPESLPCIDASTNLNVVPEIVARVIPGTMVSDHELLRRGRVLTASQLVGVADAALEMSVGYAGSRAQFGRPIGAFQAVKHRCADMAVRCAAAGALALQASIDVESGGGPPWSDTAAKTIAVDAALRNAADNVQNHGASGISEDTRAHLLVKRAWLLAQTLTQRTADLDSIIGDARRAAT